MTGDSGRIIGLYERNAQAWDRARAHDRVPFEAPWLDRFLSYVPPATTILDLGCGSGKPLAAYCIAQDYKVTGVDSSATLIGLCHSRFPAHEWLVADMRTLALGRAFAGILVWDSFFHLTPADQRLMFPVFRKHAAPGAVLMFTSGTTHGEVLGEFEGEPLYHGSLDTSEYRELLLEHGFEVLAYAAEDPDCGQHTIWLARHHAA